VGIIAGAFLALEIVGIALVAGQIGGLATFVWLLATFLSGAWLIRSAGAGFMGELLQATTSGRDPFSVMWRMGRRFLAGALLIFPGPITDVLALLLLMSAGLPRGPDPVPARTGGATAYTPHGVRHADRRPEDGVIEGEFRRED